MEKFSLRVKRDNAVIVISDEGDLISLDVDDNRFYRRIEEFYKFAKNNPLTGKEDRETAYKKQEEHVQKICLKIEELFGEGATRKIFGGLEEPTLDLIAEFLYKLKPFVEKALEKKNQSCRERKNMILNRSERRKNKKRGFHHHVQSTD